MARAFRYDADYLAEEDIRERPTPGAIGPESSRRARSFAVWATLKAYGRKGHQRLVEHCLDITQYCAGQGPRVGCKLDLMNDPQLNVVSFRYNPGGLSDEELDDLNDRLGEEMLEDGRFLVGTSKIGARTIFRPAFSNWRTRREDIDELIAVILEVAAKL